jgi:hypothetical protein
MKIYHGVLLLLSLIATYALIDNLLISKPSFKSKDTFENDNKVTTQASYNNTGNPSNRSKCFSCEKEMAEKNKEYVRHGQKCFSCETNNARNKPLFNWDPKLNRFFQGRFSNGNL